jgi:3-phosphoshikimate 1-carboxyvinyltransferase
MRIEPSPHFRGDVTLPGDKSISHRYALLAAMAEGTSHISNFSLSQDCLSTVSCLENLGVITSLTGRELRVESRGWRELRKPSTSLNAGNSGTTIRLLSALLAASPFESTIGGDDSLNQRPMKRITEPLSLMGADIRTSDGESPPLNISGTRLQGIRFRLPIPSAQVKSCLLLAGLMAEGTTTVIEGTPSRDHTERALPFFGATIQRQDGELIVRGPSSLRAVRMQVPGDFSAAVFFLVAALLVPGAQVRLL